MTDEKFELSRRNALIGIGTVGVASAGAGLGTTAFFSDQEEFADNTIQAGEFGLNVEQQIHGVDQDGIGPDELEFGENQEDGVWASVPIDITDAKPGDKYKFCWEIKVKENPGYVAVAGSFTDKTGAEASNVGADDLWDIDDNDDLKTLGETATATLITKYNKKKHEHPYDNLADLLSSLENGILVSDKKGEPIRFEAGQTVTVCLKITIPTEVGNEIQGAVTTVTKLFYAEQARHNDPYDVKSNAAAAADTDD